MTQTETDTALVRCEEERESIREELLRVRDELAALQLALDESAELMAKALRTAVTARRA